MTLLCKSCIFREFDDLQAPCDSCASGTNYVLRREDAEEKAEACENCKYEALGVADEPCKSCSKCYVSNFEKKGYWDRVTTIQKKQTAKGIINYGQRLEDNNAMTTEERLTYLEEELIDALMYIEHLKEGLE